MFASRHTFLIHTGHTPQGPSWKHALQTELLLLHGLGSRIWGGKCSHWLRVHQRVHADQSHPDVTQGLEVQVQHPPAVHLLQGDGTAANSNCCLQRFMFTKLCPTTLHRCEPPVPMKMKQPTPLQPGITAVFLTLGTINSH